MEIYEEQIITEAIEKEYKEHGDKVPPLKIPRDKYLLCHIVFFCLGLIHFLPMTFFGAANNFWMYKFRNLSDPTNSSENRTDLQKYFASTQTIANTVPSIFFGYFNVVYGHKFKIMHRLYFTICAELVVFVSFTAFTKINTDNFQTAFFVFVMIGCAVLTAANTVNIVSSTLLYPRFPHSYMKTTLIGEGTAGLIGDVLNIISVAALNDIQDSTLMYFACGTIVVAVTLILAICMAKTDFFHHCLSTMPEDLTKSKPTRTEMKSVICKIKLSIILFLTVGVGLSATHTSVTSLVVSEQKNTTWSIKYFSPVVTFFWADVCFLTGRFLASHTPLEKLSDKLLYIIGIVRLIMVPLIWFCNAQPRKHLGVLFTQDYEYAIVLGLFILLTGFLINSSILTISKKTTRDESEIAYNIFGLATGLVGTLTSVLGIFIVKIL